MPQSELLFSPSGDPQQVLELLSAQYRVAADAAEVTVWTYLDTVDWRLHRAGMSLRDTRTGPAGELVLSTRPGDQVASPSRVRSWPRRADTLPSSAVRDLIWPAVGVRALLPMAQVHVRSIPLRLTDDLDKTRVRIRVDQQRLVAPSDQPLPLRVVVAPLRGYDRDGERCARLLGQQHGEVRLARHGRDDRDDRSRPAARAAVRAQAVAGSGRSGRRVDGRGAGPVDGRHRRRAGRRARGSGSGIPARPAYRRTRDQVDPALGRRPAGRCRSGAVRG